MDSQQPLSKIERESVHREMSIATIAELVIASKSCAPEQSAELTALAGRIHLCNHKSNIFMVENAYTNRDGTSSPSVGRFWRCNSKLCSSCLARQSRRSRKQLRDALAVQQLKKHERYYFVTFTIPNPSLTLLQTRYLVNRAWSLFRKRSLCVSLIRGGVKSEEFTVTPNGFHYHLHCIFLAKYVNFQRLREDWTACVAKVFGEEQLPFQVNTSDGLLNVVIKTILPTERAVMEVCKYVTKFDSWQKIPQADLIELALIRKWNRMFELFGCFAKRETIAEGDVQPIVHNESLSDGSLPSPRPYWRDDVQKMNVEVYLINLEEKLQQAREFGLKQLASQFPGKVITTFDCM